MKTRTINHRAIGALAILLIGLCIATVAGAQTPRPWDTNILTIGAPAKCADGDVITACPVTGYRIERASSQTGTFSLLATIAANVTSYTHAGAPAGTNCYRVLATSAGGNSAPSNVDCETNARPVPGAPSLSVVERTVYDVRPNERTFAFDRGRKVGTVKLGAACDEDRTTGEDFYALERPSSAKLTREARSTALVARCGSGSGGTSGSAAAPDLHLDDGDSVPVGAGRHTAAR